MMSDDKAERYFPEILDERSTYFSSSPLTEIIQELRKKNVVTAAASAPQMTLLDSSDPWGSSEAFSLEDEWSGSPAATRCLCSLTSKKVTTPGQARERNRAPSLALDGNADGAICEICGKSKTVSTGIDAFNLPGKMRLSSWMDASRSRRLGPPKHSDALIRETPKLRIICPESMDMQGAGATASTNFLRFVLPTKSNGKSSEKGAASKTKQDYNVRSIKNHQRQADKICSLLWILAHEMSLEDYAIVESDCFTKVFALVHDSQDTNRRMAGLAALDALIDAPSADEEKKAIKFANTLSNGLRSAHGDYEFLSAVSKALGHMATRTANVDFVESEVTRALEWLRTERSDRRLAACLSLKEFAIHAPTAFYSKTSQSSLGQGGNQNLLLDSIFSGAVFDPQPIVRACAADAVTSCLNIIMERQHVSLTGILCQVYLHVMEGFDETDSKKGNDDAAVHGALLLLGSIIENTGEFMLPRYEEVCTKVMELMDTDKQLIKLEIVRLLPRLARRNNRVFARRYLQKSLAFLLSCAANPPAPRVGIDLRPPAFASIGVLVLAMVDATTGNVIGVNLPTITISDDPERPGERHLVELAEVGIISQELDTIFNLLCTTLTDRASSSREKLKQLHTAIFHCAADLIEALGDTALPYVSDLIKNMFEAGLSKDLIQCLLAIAECVPAQQSAIEDRLLQEVSVCLAGVSSARAICDPLRSFDRGTIRTELESRPRDSMGSSVEVPKVRIRINYSDDSQSVRDLVLSLQTLGSFGDSMGRVTTHGAVVPILPFVRDVAAKYLVHPSSEVRRSAALTCCILLVPPGIVRQNRVGSHSGRVIEEVLDALLRIAVSDPSPIVRLCVVRALDVRYDHFLCQTHHLRPLFLLLQDEVLTTRAAAMRLLGRLSSINPGSILPFMRKFLLDLIIELQCGVDTGRGREEATRLLVVFLRSKSFQRLVHPVLPSIVDSLPLNGATPRLVSAALEALGELAKASGESLQPWISQVVPNILETLQDQSSASKQRTSLRTLSQIAGSTGYVIQPYLDYPKLLTQATDILPGTKRAPWALRREVIRTLGVLGALDPDRYHTVAPKVRKGGAVGGAYFVYSDESPTSSEQTSDSEPKGGKKLILNDASLSAIESEEDLPAHLFMYELYAMVSQPVSRLPPARRMTPGDEEFYPTVTIQALMQIFKDPSLAVHHGMVMQAIMFIFKSLGLRCVPFLSRVVPHIMLTIRTCGPSNLRESLLKQVAILSGIVREHLRPYVADIFDVVEQFWPSRHLATIFSLVRHIAVGVPDEFKKFVPRLIRRILSSLDEIQVTDWASFDLRRGSRTRHDAKLTERFKLILQSIRNLREVMRDYLHVLVPALLKLTDSIAPLLSDDMSSGGSHKEFVELTIMSLRTISALLECESTGRISKQNIPSYRGERHDAAVSYGSLSARVVQPLVRLLGDRFQTNVEVGKAVLETLRVCAAQIGGETWTNLYHGVVRNAILTWQRGLLKSTDNTVSGTGGSQVLTLNAVEVYDDTIENLQKLPNYNSYCKILQPDAARPESLVVVTGDVFESNIGDGQFTSGIFDPTDSFDYPAPPPLQSGIVQLNKPKVNQASLQRSWDVSQCASRDDWDEWMRRLAIQLLREAPSPALRATASLAHAYQPLARELFSAAFVCCWKELSEPYRVNLVHALESAFVADVSPEILQTLLNLAEFMEHSKLEPNGGLPIDISILAELALKCRAYAKALHYKEREYSSRGASLSVEALISINRKLDLQDAALGVLKSALGQEDRSMDDESHEGQHLSAHLARHYQAHEMFYSVARSTDPKVADVGESLGLSENKEFWLAKLGSWTEALEVYEEKLLRNPQDFDAILGCMRCLSASGQWSKVLDLAERNWGSLSGMSSLTPDRRQDVSTFTLYITPRDQKKALRMCAEAAWRLGRWEDMEKYSGGLVHHQPFAKSAIISPTAANKHREVSPPGVDFDGAFFSAVLHVHRQQWTQAAKAIDDARKAMDSRFTALMAESYNRAYPSMVTAQTLAEMEEIIEFRKIEQSEADIIDVHPINRQDIHQARTRLLSVWRDRLAGCRDDAEVHSSIMAVRSLVLGPTDEIDATLTLSELSRQAQRLKLAEQVLIRPLNALGADLNGTSFGIGVSEELLFNHRVSESKSKTRSHNELITELISGDNSQIAPAYDDRHSQLAKILVNESGGLERLIIQHQLYFAYLRHLWHTDRRDEATARLDKLCHVLDMVSHSEKTRDETDSLRAACWLELGEWKLEANTAPGSILPESLQVDALSAFKRSIGLEGCGYKSWHAWALLNFRLAMQTNLTGSGEGSGTEGKEMPESSLERKHVLIAVKGFVNAISLGTKRWSASVQQDMLNLLTCLFKYGEDSEISFVINGCIESVAIEAWLGVLPQLLARIHIKNPSIRSVLHPLLVRLGEKHPQALMYPLSVLLKSPVAERKSAAESLMNSLKAHSMGLVEEALMVSSELIRVAILWLETWHEGLEDASRLYFGEGNVSGMLDLLLPLHEKVESGAETRREDEFIKSFGPDLAQAHIHIKEYVRLITTDGSTIPTSPSSSYDQSGRLARQNEDAETAMNKAWDIYYTVFRRINKQLPALTKLELTNCSPALSHAHNLELGIPGSYRVDGSYVKIESFVPNVQVITSKQRPRKITLRGSDGKDYVFLLKGHEDLRQDERVMQLFGLVNALLERDRQTKKHDLRIQRYAISPLSHNCGLVGWVPHTDTLHSLIRDYRQSKKVPLNLENREMLKIAPDFDMLTVMQKVEVFTDALARTVGKGNDLYEILWLKSTNSEEWLDRRTKFTRSLAVMSMVGYILGLGDRHPSNLMLDARSGRILHIDFGDCFEVAMNRDKYPETVPFRLTRMLIKAMEVSGIEGSYRSTCERTMSVLRESRDSLVAMLEAFVYDPLISWRLVDLGEEKENTDRTSLDADELELKSNGEGAGVTPLHTAGVPIDMGGSISNLLNEPITEDPNEEDTDDENRDQFLPGDSRAIVPASYSHPPIARSSGASSARARSIQMYSNIQTWAANLSSDARIASITGSERPDKIAAEGSIARSRMERSIRQREMMSILEKEGEAAHEEALNEKALKVIRRVQDKLTGTDFPDSNGESLDVVDQVQRLVVQATSTENLCQLFIGWCAFW